MIDFPSNGGTTSGYLAEPASGPARGRGVVVIQEWWGLNQQIRGVADRLAASGYLALAPDLYHGTVTKAPDEAGELRLAMSIPQAGKGPRGAVGCLRGRARKPAGSRG